MKKITLTTLVLLFSVCCMAQQQLAFPFQGGLPVMTNFFKDSLVVSSNIIKKRATGVVIFKFTADINGNISKIIIYYADDYILTPPIVEALKKSNHKWIIPDNEKFHDFIIPFSVAFNPPAQGKVVQKPFFNYYRHRKPILSYDQVPLNTATLLPTILVKYDVN